MDYNIAFLPVLLLFLLVLGGLLLLLILVVASRRPPSGPPIPAAPPAPPLNREQRVNILRGLAEQRMTVDEAEARLTAMGDPVPAAMPAGPAPSPAGRGCLLAVLVFLGVLGLGALLLFGYFRTFSRAGPQHDVIYRVPTPRMHHSRAAPASVAGMAEASSTAIHEENMP